MGEHEPVSDAELRQQTVIHNLVQVVSRGTPQAAAEHWSLQVGVLQREAEFKDPNVPYSRIHGREEATTSVKIQVEPMLE